MMLATVVGGGCNLLFQLFMANNIPNLAELNALLAIQYIVTVPALVVQNVLIRYVSKFKALNRDDAISWLIRRLLVLAFVAGVILSLVILIMLSVPEVRSFLNLTGGTPILILSATVFVGFIGPVGMGPLQGLQKFTYFGIQSVGSYALKLVMGMALVLLGYQMAGALGGVLIGATFATVFSLFIIRKYLFTPGTAVESREIWWFTLPAMAGVLFYTVLSQVDMIVAQALLATDPANYYAATANLAKIVLYLPSAISAVMFPKISKLHAERGSTNRSLNTAIVLSFLASALVILAYLLFPNLVLSILLPGKSEFHSQIAAILPGLSVAMMFLGLSNLFMLYGLATDGHVYIVIMGLTLLVFGLLVGGVVMLGIFLTPELLTLIMILTGLFSVILSGIYLILVEREWRPSNPRKSS
jgi:O-antigen/teichoic acid export membrane protein